VRHIIDDKLYNSLMTTGSSGLYASTREAVIHIFILCSDAHFSYDPHCITIIRWAMSDVLQDGYFKFTEKP
jgi:hypothetical protein